MASYSVHRNGATDLEKRVKAALADFRKSQGQEPAAVTVHKSEVVKARDLGLALEVRGCGGCIVPEVWLALPEQGGAGSLVQALLWERG